MASSERAIRTDIAVVHRDNRSFGGPSAKPRSARGGERPIADMLISTCYVMPGLPRRDIDLLTKWKRVACLASLLTASCNRSPDEPVTKFINENGKPISWTTGDRIRAEGRIRRISNSVYILVSHSRVKHHTTENCLLIRGLGYFWTPDSIKISLVSDTARLVALTGKSTEAVPRYASVTDNNACNADIVVDRVTIL